MRLHILQRAWVTRLQRRMAQSSSTSHQLPVKMADIQEAEERIRDHIHHTPVMTCSKLDSLSGHKLFFKCELFQKAGSFKIRGATNMIMKRFPPGCDLSGAAVVTHSSGNHAQGLALAARQRGIPAHIVMPKGTPAVKEAAVREYGGNIIFCENSEQARVRKTEEVLERLGPSAVMVPSSDHPDIMAGQATIATELLHQVPGLDVIVGSVSVGGMVAGLSVAAKSINPAIKVVAAEPRNADDISRSFAAGRRMVNESPPKTVAEALRMSVGEGVWPILQTNLTGVITVSEQEIISTTKLVWERMKLLVEPSAAVAVAAVLSQQFQEVVGSSSCQLKVGVVLCGGNLDLDHLPWMTS